MASKCLIFILRFGFAGIPATGQFFNSTKIDSTENNHRIVIQLLLALRVRSI